MSQKRTALITGCSKGGAGDALAQEFHRNGIRALATGRDLSKLEHLKGLGIETLQLDVEDSESIKAAAKAVAKMTGGKLDFLVNNAGMGELLRVHAPPLSRTSRADVGAEQGITPPSSTRTSSA